jgi:ketosteroid isomerase-like protein
MTEDTAATLSVADRIEIHELAAWYGIVIDDRDWEGLARVFTDDAVFVTSGFGPGRDQRIEGLAAIRAYMDGARHPVAHHVTNVAVEIDASGVRLRSKIVGTLPKGRAGSADYRDRLRHTSQGWRIAERLVTLRRADPD